MVKIAVLDCVSPDQLTAKYGPSGNHILRWLAPHLPEAELVRYDLPGGDAPPAIGEVDGIVISGSEKGVYDATDWMPRLREALLIYRDAKTPVFGICFGHQLMADVWGGKAEKADKGFIGGTRKFGANDGKIDAYVAHQDQVTQTPPNATVTASADYCPVAALSYDFPAMSVQFHPEYDQNFASDLLEMYGDTLMSAEELAAARETLSVDVSKDLYGQEVAKFFRDNSKA